MDINTEQFKRRIANAFQVNMKAPNHSQEENDLMIHPKSFDRRLQRIKERCKCMHLSYPRHMVAPCCDQCNINEIGKCDFCERYNDYCFCDQYNRRLEWITNEKFQYAADVINVCIICGFQMCHCLSDPGMPCTTSGLIYCPCVLERQKVISAMPLSMITNKTTRTHQEQVRRMLMELFFKQVLSQALYDECFQEAQNMDEIIQGARKMSSRVKIHGESFVKKLRKINNPLSAIKSLDKRDDVKFFRYALIFKFHSTVLDHDLFTEILNKPKTREEENSLMDSIRALQLEVLSSEEEMDFEDGCRCEKKPRVENHPRKAEEVVVAKKREKMTEKSGQKNKKPDFNRAVGSVGNGSMIRSIWSPTVVAGMHPIM